MARSLGGFISLRMAERMGCLASTLYHELLHTTGQVFDVPNGNVPPAADYEKACIGNLCKKSSR